MIVRARKDLRHATFGGGECATLTSGREYRVIELHRADFRVLSDDFDPGLYPRELFKLVDPAVEPAWILNNNPDPQELCLTFPEFNSRGFWCRLFDSLPEEVAIYRNAMIRYGFDPASSWERSSIFTNPPTPQR